MTATLIALLFFGAVMTMTYRQTQRRVAQDVAEAWLPPEPEAVKPEPEPLRVTVPRTARPAPSPPAAAGRAYLLQPTGSAPDRTAATLRMMAGPGLCTPRDC